MHPIKRSLVPAATVIALLALGCSAKVGSSTHTAAQTVSVSVDPGETTLVTGQSGQFTATVNGTLNAAVTWQVDESGGGRIGADGVYTAPATTGTYHVRAVSQADSNASGVAAVTVVEAPAGTVTISPKTIGVSASGTVTFTALTSGLASSAVTWSVRETSGCGSVSTAGVYSAPAAAATCHVVATSAADTSKSDVATVTVSGPLSVSISPARTTVDACRTVTLSATVTGSTDRAVAWSVQESGGGTITSAGVYTAPSTAGQYHVIATAHASSKVTATATITVQDHILSVAVNPASTSVAVNGTLQFSATVTTSCGTFAASGP